MNDSEVATYVIVGRAVWNYFVRPMEEQHMQGIFGDEYDTYRRSVRCWFPRRKSNRLKQNLPS